MNFGFINTQECIISTATTPPDPRCQDPAFAAANPDICPVSGQTKLIIKPGVALTCTLGSIQFGSFLAVNGAETDVSKSAVYTSSDLDIVLVGASSGNATGVAQGTAVITATYQDSQGNAYSASAEMTVIGTATFGDCCSTRRVAMMVMVDNSLSMSLQFSSTYATRLDFAKAAATQFISEVNPLKDLVGLMSFNGAGYNILSPISSVPVVSSDGKVSYINYPGPPVPGQLGQPASLVYDADGAIWKVTTGDGTIRYISYSGPPDPTKPVQLGEIVIDSDGTLWKFNPKTGNWDG